MICCIENWTSVSTSGDFEMIKGFSEIFVNKNALQNHL